MSSFAEKILENLNKFRVDHSSIRKQCELVRLGLSRLRGSDPFLKEIDKFISSIDSLPKMKKLILNDELTDIAQEELKKFIANPKKYKKYQQGSQLNNVVPEYYYDQEPGLIGDDGADEPETAIPKILLNKLDKDKVGRTLLTYPSYTQIGIAHQVQDDENYLILLFANEYAEEPPKPIIKEPEKTFEDIKTEVGNLVVDILNKYFEDKPEYLDDQAAGWGKEVINQIMKALMELYPKGYKFIVNATILEKEASLNHDSNSYWNPTQDGLIQGNFENEEYFCFASAYIIKQDC